MKIIFKKTNKYFNIYFYNNNKIIYFFNFLKKKFLNKFEKIKKILLFFNYKINFQKYNYKGYIKQIINFINNGE